MATHLSGTPQAANLAAQGRSLAQRAFAAGLAITDAEGAPAPIPIGAIPVVLAAAEIEARVQCAARLTRAILRVAHWRMGAEQREATLAALRPTERRIVAATWQRSRTLAVSRVDFLGEPAPLALEVNATIPAMQGYSDIAASAWLSTYAPAGEAQRLIDANGSNVAALRDALLDLFEQQRGGRPRALGVLCRRRDAQLTELDHLRRRFEASGLAVQLVYPDELTWDEDAATLRHHGRALDLVYRHLFLGRLDDAPSAALEAALLSPHPHATLVLNPAAPHLEMKSTLALLSQAAGDDTLARSIGLTDDERAAAQAQVPWTRWLQPDPLAPARLAETIEQVSAHPDEYVLKRSWSYGGRDVFVGAARHGEGVWHEWQRSFPDVQSWPELVRRASQDPRGGGFVAQRRVPSPRTRQWLCSPDRVVEAEVTTDYAAYASLGATPAWTGVARASTGEIVNLVRGGALVPVLRREVVTHLPGFLDSARATG